MKRFLLFSGLLIAGAPVFSQQQSTAEMYTTAKNFMRQGDYDNATLVFNRLLEQDPNNTDALKDFAYLSFIKRDYSKCIEISKGLVERPDADVQSYQILGMGYKAIAENKECAKMYKKALLKFPNSGVIYNDYGELFAADKNLPEAIQMWEAGIKADPNNNSNYYNATMYYATTGNLFWALIYGEIFVNIESYTQRTADIKAILWDGYKKLYISTNFSKYFTDKKNVFEKTFFETLGKSAVLASDGVTPENICAMRTRFILDWYTAKNNEKFPFRLFENQQYLLKEGMFDAYNQWIFGLANNPSVYQVWIDTHDKEAAAFKEFQQGRVFKLTTGQYYRGN